MVITLNKIVERVKKEFNKTPDLIIKEIKLNLINTLYVIYLETVSGSDKINDYILKNIIIGKTNNKINKQNLLSFLAGPNTKKNVSEDEIEFYLTNGFTIVIFKDVIVAVETRADINRSISNADVETSINGPKDSFTENYQICNTRSFIERWGKILTQRPTVSC